MTSTAIVVGMGRGRIAQDLAYTPDRSNTTCPSGRHWAHHGIILRSPCKATSASSIPATAADTLSQSTSVVGIAVMSERAASAGIVPLLYIIAIVSLSLAVVNLLPLPPLDGGRILIEVINVSRIARCPRASSTRLPSSSSRCCLSCSSSCCGRTSSTSS